MSDERKKKRQEPQESQPQRKNLLLFAVVIVMLVLSYGAGRYYRGHKYDSFARCLASKQARMYGLYWCPHCADQKAMFGSSFHYVPYVECALGPPGSDLAPACKAAGVKLFPSWQFGNEPPKEGVVSLQALSEKTGCRLP